ncbi:MAG: hypothetical protein ACJ76Y_23120 [Thermoanaerobaculia bacterium]
MAAAAQEEKALNLKPFADGDHVIYFPTNIVAKRAVPSKANISYHGGPVITSAKVVLIFWGPSFANAGSSDNAYATTLRNFRNQFGTTGEYNTITQYSGIQLANLGSGGADWFDTSTPPTNVTDSSVHSEVNRYFSGGHGTYNSSTIYEVVIPSSSYSSSGSSTSCGGPSLAYCAYHGHFSGTSGDVKYSIQPFPSCSGCKVSGWSNVQNQEHFMCHETREAVTDPDLNAWFDNVGNEADDKCAWSPSPFIGTNGYGYQYEWSNANGGCVRTR